MSVTVYVDGWADQPYTVCKEYVDWCSDDCAQSLGYPKDDKGYYSETKMYENVFPEMNLSNSNWQSIADILDVPFYGEIKEADIPIYIRKCMIILNVKSIAELYTREDVHEGNFHSFGINSEYIRIRIDEFMSMLQFAQNQHADIYWG